MGLFSSIDEGYYALEEAVSSFIPPSQLRFLFARIILEGYPALPLWNSFKDSIAIDFIQTLHSYEQGINHTLQQIEEFIQDSGRRLQDFGLPRPIYHSPEVLNELEAFSNRLSILRANALTALATMNLEQQSLLSTIYNAITNLNPQTFFSPIFIEGRPGRGKTFLMNAIVNILRSEGKIILVVGTSALAASLYERGRTAHSLFEIPITDVRSPFPLHTPMTYNIYLFIQNNANVHSKIHLTSHRAQLINAASAIIWEELAAANKSAVECCDTVCRQIRKLNQPFGGIPFIGLGDFHQIPPVIKSAGETAILQASMKSSFLWKSFTIHSLLHPHRTQSDPEYTTLIDNIGDDFNNPQPSLSIIDCITSLNDARQYLFPPEILQTPFLALKRAFLSPLNIYVDEFNDMILDHLPGQIGTIP
jgi:hypothetical protein